MFNLQQFITDHVICRPIGLFAADVKTNENTPQVGIENKSVCVIDGVGSIGSSSIRALLPFKPSKLIVIDLDENGFVELTCDLRFTYDMYVPTEYRTYTLNFVDPVFERIFREEKGFDIVANFSAHRHARSEKDKCSVQTSIENNDIKAKRLLDLLTVYPPKHFFYVSIDKTANPVNITDASKRIMEDTIMAYSSKFKVTTACFANVASSNGSPPDGWTQRVMKEQPLTTPNDVERYFVSPEESGQICMLACILSRNGEIFFPKLGEEQMLMFSSICDEHMGTIGCVKKKLTTDEEAKLFASDMASDNKSYSVVYSSSDTTGERVYGEFCIPGEKMNLEHFTNLDMIEEMKKRSVMEINSLFSKVERIFAGPGFIKEEVVAVIRRFLPNFEHVEKGKDLDQKT